ncbi:hypothetical protein [Zhihengliuella halotolerans]|uniref:hypothetical protein n=1 Tax=Zhihengliuella halotolerans TaxID=370736 RepID=UPI000C80BC25|nr:hypothetical protein [Zhihengliuella halotolerans]
MSNDELNPRAKAAAELAGKIADENDQGAPFMLQALEFAEAIRPDGTVDLDKISDDSKERYLRAMRKNSPLKSVRDGHAVLEKRRLAREEAARRHREDNE